MNVQETTETLEGQLVAQILEDGKKTTKITDAQLVRLRAIKDTARATNIAEIRVANALQSVVVNHDNLKKLIDYCYAKGIYDGDTDDYIAYANPVVEHSNRRTMKLAWWIRAGYLLGREIDTPCLIRFFSELTADEERMSDTKFAAEWNDKDADKRRKSRITRDIIKDTSTGETASSSSKPTGHECALKSKCTRAVKRHGFMIPAGSQRLYCGPACRERAKWHNKGGDDQEE